MPADIDQLLADAAAVPTRPIDTAALRARALRARRRDRLVTGLGVLALLAVMVTLLTGRGDVVELGPADPPAATPDLAPAAAQRFVITATAEADPALVGLEVEATDPGEVAAGGPADHELIVTATQPTGVEGLVHLDATAHGEAGALRVLGICADSVEEPRSCAAIPAFAQGEVPWRMPVRLRTDELAAGIYELSVSLNRVNDGAPSPPVHLTYTVTEVTAATGDVTEDGGTAPPPTTRRVRTSSSSPNRTACRPAAPSPW
jgi:hypothetical protein